MAAAIAAVATVEGDEDECRASNANEVGSAPNCAPEWLHPPGRGSRR